MSLIEGIGDEVIEFFFALLVVIIGTVAWWSTRITDIPAFRTVLVFERRSRTHPIPESTQNQTSSTVTTNEQASQSYVTNTLEENKPGGSTNVETDADDASDNVDGASESDSRQDLTLEEEEQNTIIHNMDSNNMVRRRRLEFFNQQETRNGANGDTLQNNDNSMDCNNPTVENTENIESETAEYRVEEIQQNTSPVDENTITIKLKYINDDLKLVNGHLNEQLGDFRRRHFQSELTSNKLVKLIFNGQILQRDDMTLQSCGLFDNCVVHCLVHQKRTNHLDQNTTDTNVNSDPSGGNNNRTRLNGGGSRDQAREWDLGNLFFIIVSFCLGAAWYFRYEYAQLYTVTATMALVGLTGIFTVLLIGMYFPDPEPVQAAS